MKPFTIVERRVVKTVVVRRIPCRSLSVAARYYLRKYYKTGKMSQSAIARKFHVTPQCVNEQAKDLGMVHAR
jgi:hypothetical protein